MATATELAPLSTWARSSGLRKGWFRSFSYRVDKDSPSITANIHFERLAISKSRTQPFPFLLLWAGAVARDGSCPNKVRFRKRGKPPFVRLSPKGPYLKILWRRHLVRTDDKARQSGVFAIAARRQEHVNIEPLQPLWWPSLLKFIDVRQCFLRFR